MQNLTNVRRKAQKLAQKGATSEALEAYAKLAEDGHLEPYDLVVYGDLLGRSGNRKESVERYLEAMDSYARAGLHRNAIALGKKVRRLDPEATHVHRKLGELYAAEGLASESCLHFMEFLEHADIEENGVPESVEDVCRKLLDLSLPSFQVVPRIVQAARTVGREKSLADGMMHQIRRAGSLDNREAESELRKLLSEMDPSQAAPPSAGEAEAAPAEAAGVEDSRYTIDVGDLSDLSGADAHPEGEPAEIEWNPESGEAEGTGEPVTIEDAPVLSLDGFSFDEPTDGGNQAGGLFEGLVEPEVIEIEPGVSGPQAASDAEEVPGADSASAESSGLAEDPDALRAQGIRALERSDTVRAQRAFMSAAALYFEAARSRDAWDLYERVLKMDPNHLDALRGLVEIAHINGEKAKMAHWGCELGDVLLAREMYPEAKVQFERVLAFDPQNAKAQSRLKRLNTIAGVKEAGFGELAPSAREVQGAQVVIRDEEAASSQSTLNLSQILEEFRASVVEHIPSTDTQSHYDLGMTYKEMGLLDEALAEFEMAAGSQESRAGSLEMMGECYLLLSRFEDSVAVLEELVAECGGRAEAPVHLKLGRAYEILGDWDRAEEEYHRALEIDENIEEAVELLQSLTLRRSQGAA